MGSEYGGKSITPYQFLIEAAFIMIEEIVRAV
jgi:hypothetical protein